MVGIRSWEYFYKSRRGHKHKAQDTGSASAISLPVFSSNPYHAGQESVYRQIINLGSQRSVERAGWGPVSSGNDQQEHRKDYGREERHQSSRSAVKDQADRSDNDDRQPRREQRACLWQRYALCLLIGDGMPPEMIQHRTKRRLRRQIDGCRNDRSDNPGGHGKDSREFREFGELGELR